KMIVQPTSTDDIGAFYLLAPKGHIGQTVVGKIIILPIFFIITEAPCIVERRVQMQLFAYIICIMEMRMCLCIVICLVVVCVIIIFAISIDQTIVFRATE